MIKIQQKIWFYLSAGLFLLPELLWSPISNIYIQLLQTNITSNTVPFRDSFLQNSSNIFYLKFVIFLQLVGVLSLLLYFIKNKVIKNAILNILLICVFVILAILISLAFYIVISLNIEVF